MTTLPDLLYVALFAVALPLWDYLVFWPAFHRQSQVDPARARTRLWKQAIGGAWPLVAVGAALWVANDRSWTSFGFSVPDGWRLWTSIALFLLHAGRGDFQLPLAGDRAARPPRSRPGNVRVAGVARGANNSRPDGSRKANGNAIGIGSRIESGTGRTRRCT